MLHWLVDVKAATRRIVRFEDFLVGIFPTGQLAQRNALLARLSTTI